MIFALINEAIIAEVSAGGAAFRSLLWVIGLSWLFWYEYKRGPRATTKFDNKAFHYAALTVIAVGIIANAVLLVLLTAAAFTV